MASLTAEMQAAFAASDIFPFATAGADGDPNVVPVRFVRVRDPQTLWITDNFFRKTLANLQANPRAALYLWQPAAELSVQIKGTTQILTTGSEYAEMRRYVQAARADLPARSLVILSILEIYHCMPGPEAGLRLA